MEDRHRGIGRMTIYRMYAENGNRAGFWVQHRTWKENCAQVVSIGGMQDGKLRGSGPHFDHAEVVLRGYDVRSGRPVQLASSPDFSADHSYTMIAEPGWYRRSAVMLGHVH